MDAVKFKEYENNKVFKRKLKGVDKALLIKWIVYVYDTNSPIAKIADITKRYMVAAMEAGFPYANKKFPKDYKAVITFDPSVRVPLGEMIIEYCKLQRGSTYSQLAVYENLRMSNNSKLLDPELEPSDMAKILDVQNKLTTNIETLRDKFFLGDDSQDIYTELMAYIETDNLEFSPEQIVLNKEIREAVENGSPYGKWQFRRYEMKDLTVEEKRRLDDLLNNNTIEAKNHFKSLGIEWEENSH
jgi:hypothetical protein